MQRIASCPCQSRIIRPPPGLEDNRLAGQHTLVMLGACTWRRKLWNARDKKCGCDIMIDQRRPKQDLLFRHATKGRLSVPTERPPSLRVWPVVHERQVAYPRVKTPPISVELACSWVAGRRPGVSRKSIYATHASSASGIISQGRRRIRRKDWPRSRAAVGM